MVSLARPHPSPLVAKQALKLWHVLFLGWLFWFLFFLPGPVNGATVAIARDVVIGGPYGQLTVLNEQQTVNWYATYANGTVYFDIAGVEDVQSFYDYRVRSYGNGTMLIRFSGRTPVSTNQAPIATYTAGEQQFRFSRDETNQLCVSYTTGFCPGLGGGLVTLPNILLVVAGVFLLMVVAVGVLSLRDRRRGY